jgi:hypothetical protein
MNRIIFLLLAAVSLSGCCFSCGESEDSAKRTFKVGQSRIEVTATSRSYQTNGANRLDWGERAHSLTVRARVDDRPEFTVGRTLTQEHMDKGDLKSMLDDMQWKLSPNGQHLSLQSKQPFPTRFYLLPSGGPAFSTPQVPPPDESRAAMDIAREAIAVRSECFKNRDLFRAVSFSMDEALQRELLQTCAPEASNAAASEDIDARLALSVDACDIYSGCNNSAFELCLAVRSSPCHENAVAYTLRSCSPTSCFQVALLKEYATPEEAKLLKERCGDCR